MKKIVGWLLVVLLVTLYCNIGWTVGNYYYKHVFSVPHQNLTTLGKAAAGGWSMNTLSTENKSLEYNRVTATIFYGIAWPIGLFATIGSWVVYGGYYFLWFTVWGGIVKSIGLV